MYYCPPSYHVEKEHQEQQKETDGDFQSSTSTVQALVSAIQSLISFLGDTKGSKDK